MNYSETVESWHWIATLIIAGMVLLLLWVGQLPREWSGIIPLVTIQWFLIKGYVLWLRKRREPH